MELRHLRYFVAVAEAGSLKLAAETILHTSQPSLSRQIRDLEGEVGVLLLERSPRGVALTPAGMAFLDEARESLARAGAAVERARLAARTPRPVFAVGFVVGHEIDCIPPATRMLRDELPGLELRIFGGFSVDLAEQLRRGTLDVAFLRCEPGYDFEQRMLLAEPIVAVLRADHALARGRALDPRDLVGETFIGISPVPRVLRGVVLGYLERSGVRIVPEVEIDNFAMALTLVSSTGGVALLPASIRHYLPPSIVSLPLAGEPPTIDLVVACRRDDRSAVLRGFLERLDQLAAEIRREGGERQRWL